MTRPEEPLRQLREALRHAVDAEKLRPFARRTEIPLGQIRSVLSGRSARLTHAAAICSALGLSLRIVPDDKAGDGPEAARSRAGNVQPAVAERKIVAALVDALRDAGYRVEAPADEADS